MFSVGLLTSPAGVGIACACVHFSAPFLNNSLRDTPPETFYFNYIITNFKSQHEIRARNEKSQKDRICVSGKKRRE